MRSVAKVVLASCLALACLLLPTAPASSGGAVTMPQPTALTATAVSPTGLRIGWTAPTDATRWWVIVTGPTDRSVAQRTACGGCRSVVVEHLAPGSSYFVRVVGVDTAGSFGPFSTWITATTPPVAGCAGVTGSVCAYIDASSSAGTAGGVGLGSLHGITADTDADRVGALEPTAWRLSAMDFERFAVARTHGGSVTALLSDPWMNATGSEAPWVNWPLYEWWVGVVVDAHVAMDAVPDFWEVQNEPGPSSYVGGAAATSDLVFEQYRRAAAVIRGRLPDAEVIGPSLGYVRFGSGLADVDGFAQRAAAGGAGLGGLSWHEIGASCLGYCDGSPRAVLQHADDARAALAANGLTGVPLHVNEWGAPWNYRQPGAAVGYLSSLAYAGIAVANPACWDTTCFAQPGTLDGLLLDDGLTPTDAWFAHRAFAAITGPDARLVGGSIADPEASVVATLDPTGTIRVLLGRHTGCQTGIDANCPGAAYAAPRAVQILVATGTGSPASYTATIERIPSVAGALTAPTGVAHREVSVLDGRVDVGSYTVADGEALVITLVPAETTPPPSTTTTTTPPTTTTTTTTPPTTTTTTSIPPGRRPRR